MTICKEMMDGAVQNAQGMSQSARLEVEYYVKELAKHAGHVARGMTHLVEKLEEQGADASINSLGELQGQAHEVDRLCAVIAEKKLILAACEEAVSVLKALAGDVEE